MKKLFKLILLSGIISAMLLFAASAADNVVYLKDGGTGDGLTAESAVGTLAKAYGALDLEREATVVICGTFTQEADFVYGVEHSKSVTFTSVYGDVDYRLSGAVWQFNGSRFACFGDTAFENINFVSLGGSYRVIGQHNAVTVGEGVSISGEGLLGTKISNSFAIIGGYEKGITGAKTLDDSDTSITVLSGGYLYIVPFSYNVSGTYKGSSNVYIGGSADVYRLLGSAAYPKNIALGNVRIVIDGEADVHALYGCVANVTLDSFEVEWRSGKFRSLKWTVNEGDVLTVEENSTLRVTDKAAATMYYEEIAGNFDFVVLDKEIKPEGIAAAISESDSAFLNSRPGDKQYNALFFPEASEGTQIALRIPSGETLGGVYMINGDFFEAVDADAVGNGLMAFDLDSAGTYVCGDENFLIYGDVNGDGEVSVADTLGVLRIALDGDSGIFDKAASDMDGNKQINMIDVLRQMKKVVTPTIPEEEFNPDDYYVISVVRYLDKTKLGFLSQIVGFLSGFEFARDPVTKLPMLAMDDSYFEMCNGAYAEPKDFNPHGDKHLYNEETGIWEVWNDDDFSIDILNQYILRDMYAQYGTVNTKVITDDWIKYDVYDMGGGNRDIGAYGLMKNYQYLSVFAGNTEMCNNFNVNGEPYIGNETLGMVAPGMPDLAVDLAYKFGSTTSDRDPLDWLRMFAAMYSMAYFENDVQTLIRTAQKATMPEGSWTYEVVDKCFELYEKYPDDWRAAVVEADKVFRSLNYDNSSYMGCSSINCSFIILGLLYGDGDYYDTCKIISLAGHGGDSTTPTALGIVGIICGWSHLDEVSRGIIEEKVWQDGQGTIVNRPLDPEGSYGVWMHMAGLEERFNIRELIYLYQANFENLLYENGGFKKGGNYYIPKNTISQIDTVYTEHFENGGITSFEVVGGTVANAADPFMGSNALELIASKDKESVAYTTVSGLVVGRTYNLNAFIRTGDGVTANMFVREVGGKILNYETVHDSNVYVRRFTTGVGENDMCSYVKRQLVFTATASTMEIGLMLPATTVEGGSAAIDAINLIRFDEEEICDVAVVGEKKANGAYNGLVRFEIDGGAEKEVWLKLTYSSNAAGLDKAITLVNRAWQSRTPIVPTNGGNVTIYVPVLVNKGKDNLVTMYFGETDVTIIEAALVNARF